MLQQADALRLLFSSTSLLRVVASARQVGGASLHPNLIEVLNALGRGES